MNSYDRQSAPGRTWTRAETLSAAGLLVVIAVLFSGLTIPSELLFYRGDWLYFRGLEYSLRDALAQGHLPLWNSYIAEPLLANPQTMVFYPISALLRLLPAEAAIHLYVILTFWLTGVAMLLLLRDLGQGHAASAGGAVAFALSTTLISRAYIGHVSILPVFPWAILALVFYRRLLLRGGWSNFYLAVLCVACLALAGHPQLSLTGLLLPVGYFGVWAVGRLRARQVGQVARAAALSLSIGLVAAGVIAVQLLSTVEYLPLTARGGGLNLKKACRGSLSVPLLTTIFAPYVYHDAVQDLAYAHEMLPYTTLIAPGLALIALRARQAATRRRAWLLLGVAGLMLLVAMGCYTPVYRLIYLAMPFIRVPGRFLLLWAFCLATLTAMGIDELLGLDPAARQRALRLLWLPVGIAFATVSVVGVVTLVREQMLLASVKTLWRTFFSGCVTLATVGVWGAILLILRRRPDRRLASALLVGGILVDTLLTIAYIPLWPAYQETWPSVADWYLPAGDTRLESLHLDPTQIRLGLRTNHTLTFVAASQGVASLQSYTANLAYVRDLMKLDDRGMQLLASSTYLAEEPLVEDGWEIVAEGDGLYVSQQAGAIPRVFVVPAVRAIADDRASLDVLRDEAFDPLALAIVNTDGAGPALDGAPSDPITYMAEIVAYDSEQVALQVEADRPGMVVLAEPYFPGWQATVNGEAATIWRVDYASRGVVVAAGRSQVVMRYRPASVRRGLWISLATLAALALAPLIRMGVRRVTARPAA